jgi:thiosulfate/3-mercaptopyruvate sulfurtransferase
MDTRSPMEFEGKAARAKRMGHIPGALNVPRGTLLNEDGTMMAGDQLRELFVEAGLDIDAPEIVVYCNGGVSASYGLMALKMAGFENGAMYDGSWKEWGNDEGKPIEV